MNINEDSKLENCIEECSHFESVSSKEPNTKDVEQACDLSDFHHDQLVQQENTKFNSAHEKTETRQYTETLRLQNRVDCSEEFTHSSNLNVDTIYLKTECADQEEICTNDFKINNKNVKQESCNEESKCPQTVHIKEEPSDSIQEQHDLLECEVVVKEEDRDIIIDNDPKNNYSGSDSGTAQDIYTPFTIQLYEYEESGISLHQNKKVETENIAKHVCNICGKEFRRKHFLKPHLETHNTAKIYQCDTCNKIYTERIHFGKHLLTHEVKRYYACDFCGKTLSNKSNLYYHILRHENVRKHKCNICDLSFLHRAKLREHAAVHSQVRSYVCHICNNAFKWKGNLEAHMTVHSEKNFNLNDNSVAPYKCDICSKTFTRKYGLKCHLRYHSNDIKLHTCNVCGRSFRQKPSYRAHLETHTNIRSHHCDVCDKYFSDTRYFKQHIETHSEKRNHVCDTCGRSFTRKPYLTQHLLTHKIVKPHVCHICDKSFIRKAQLLTHLESH